ncbi:MAG TPA: hypothetical protein VHP11_10785 [Tepidisphaeraceae bacterium]|nr:hypothetical protein [Tepidisphaeraceae bacterium]
MASEVLPLDRKTANAEARENLWMRSWRIGAELGSLAAGVAILMGLGHWLWRPEAEPMLIAPAVVQAQAADLRVPAMPEMPGDVPIVPEYETFSLPSMPSFPSLMEAAASPQESPTTQETIL